MLIPYNAPAGFDWVTRATHWQQQDNTLIIDVGTAYDKTTQVIFRVLTPDIWQIEFAAPGAQAAAPTPMVVGKFDAPRLNVKPMGKRCCWLTWPDYLPANLPKR